MRRLAPWPPIGLALLLLVACDGSDSPTSTPALATGSDRSALCARAAPCDETPNRAHTWALRACLEGVWTADQARCVAQAASCGAVRGCLGWPEPGAAVCEGSVMNARLGLGPSQRVDCAALALPAGPARCEPGVGCVASEGARWQACTADGKAVSGVYAWVEPAICGSPEEDPCEPYLEYDFQLEDCALQGLGCVDGVCLDARPQPCVRAECAGDTFVDCPRGGDGRLGTRRVDCAARGEGWTCVDDGFGTGCRLPQPACDGPARCEGEQLVVCVEGQPHTVDCRAAGLACEADEPPSSCRP